MNNRFKRSNAPRLSPAEADRQGRISTLALSVLGNVEAMAFLNGWDDALGGRPLDLAIQDDAGFASVEAALTKLRA